MRELHLFAGAGGGILGSLLLGHTCVCAVEIEPYCRKVLLQRQRDGILPKFPIWDDVRTFDGKPWRGKIDVICGGFPCKDISSAKQNAKGLDGKHSGLWSEQKRIIGEIQPEKVFIENSPNLRTRGLVRVIKDLASMGYSSRWGVISAENAGALHQRKRMWIVADSSMCNGGNVLRVNLGKEELPESSNCCPLLDNTDIKGSQGTYDYEELSKRVYTVFGERCKETTPYWTVEPELGRVVNGLACRVDRLKAIGNGQVPEVVRIAWNILS